MGFLPYSSFIAFRVAAEAVFDVVGQDEIQLLPSESDVRHQHVVDFVDDIFRRTWPKLLA